MQEASQREASTLYRARSSAVFAGSNLKDEITFPSGMKCTRAWLPLMKSWGPPRLRVSQLQPKTTACAAPPGCPHLPTWGWARARKQNTGLLTTCCAVSKNALCLWPRNLLSSASIREAVTGWVLSLYAGSNPRAGQIPFPTHSHMLRRCTCGLIFPFPRPKGRISHTWLQVLLFWCNNVSRNLHIPIENFSSLSCSSTGAQWQMSCAFPVPDWWILRSSLLFRYCKHCCSK